MDITLAADRGRVAEPDGDGGDHFLELTLHIALVANRQFAQRRQGLDGRVPGPEILRRERPPAGLAQVLIDIVGIDPDRKSVV